MSLEVKIVSGNGNGEELEVSPYCASKSHPITPPLLPVGTANRMRPFIEKVDIHNGGTDGSVNPVTFDLLTSDPASEFDYYVQGISIVVSDGTQNYSKYGAISALTNGVDMYTEISGDTDYLVQSAKTGGELVLWAGIGSIFPANPATITGWSANDDALVAVFDLNELIPGTGGLSGIRIGRGTKDKLRFTVNDNLTALSDHFVFVKGFRLYE